MFRGAVDGRGACLRTEQVPVTRSDRIAEGHRWSVSEGASYQNLVELVQHRGRHHSHLGWMLDSKMTNTVKFARDVLREPLLARVNDLYFTWVALGVAIPAVLGGLLTWSWMGVLTGFLWGGMVRLFLAHHAMWTSGSTAHIFGTRPFDTRDKSTNNGLLALPNLGEAWHNNHHAFPSSAIFGLEWWQVDIGGAVIRLFEKLGWAWEVRVPTRQMIVEKKAAGEPRAACTSGSPGQNECVSTKHRDRRWMPL